MKENDDLATPKPGLPLGFAIGLCLAAVIGLGLWPSPLVERHRRGAALRSRFRRRTTRRARRW
jgi:hypothetical protein